MKKLYTFKLKLHLLLTFSVFVLSASAQTLTDSNLPIVVINTDNDPNTSLPLEILDDPRVLATMKIIKHTDGSRNFMTDINNATHLNYNGRINIEIRGSSSQALSKKPYSLTTLLANNTTVNNVSLLGMPAENDWVLNSLAFDPSLIRDYLAYDISRKMGNYAARTQYCEVVINNEYRGLYMLQEKLKADSNRVNILKITTADNTGDNLTGGYITKADKTTGGDPVAWSTTAYGGGDTNYIHELPKPIDVTTQQNDYIKLQFDNLQSQITASNVSLLDGYTTTIDIPSFVDFMVSNEFAANVDGYQFSTYFHKDRKGKLRAGPIWDFNLTLGNDLFVWGYDRSFYNTWQFSNGDNEGSKFWRDLFNNTEFKCYFSKRWNQLIQTGQPLNQTVLNTFIDNTIVLITEAMGREHQKWNTIPNNALEITNLKTWIGNRTTWINSQIGPFAACSNVVTPPLVISKINYNPSVTTTFTVSNDQEFVQITNTGASTVNLSGVYFKELGLSYQFPYNSTISGNSSLYLASNATVFQAKNGFAPFGVFARNLSNKSQKIVLADAFGNTIDTVEYFDTAPWPVAADGLGSYLQLINNSLDNNLASSWVASTTALPVEKFQYNINITLYPNPTTGIFTIKTDVLNYSKLELIDVYGKLVKTQSINEDEAQIDISSFATGVYFLKLYNDFGVSTQKIVKQ
jgi:hypothetical protein